MSYFCACGIFFVSFRFILFSVRIISERQNWIHSTKLSIWFERCHVISALIHQKSVIATLICIKKRKIKPMNRHATRWPMNMFGNLNLSERKSSYWMRKSIKMWVKFIQCKTTGNIWILVSKWLILHSFFLKKKIRISNSKPTMKQYPRHMQLYNRNWNHSQRIITQSAATMIFRYGQAHKSSVENIAQNNLTNSN